MKILKTIFAAAVLSTTLITGACTPISGDQARAVYQTSGGGGHTDSGNPLGGYQDRDPDGRVERPDRTPIIDGGVVVLNPGETPPAVDDDVSTPPDPIRTPEPDRSPEPAPAQPDAPTFQPVSSGVASAEPAAQPAPQPERTPEPEPAPAPAPTPEPAQEPEPAAAPAPAPEPAPADPNNPTFGQDNS